MRDASATWATGFNPSREIRFEGSIQHGNGKSQIGLVVPLSLITRLAEILKYTDSAGHAIWHQQNPQAPFPCSSCDRQPTMAETFVGYYREWEDLTPEEHERTGSTFTDFSEYARGRADSQGKDLTYLQFWNCRPCENNGIAHANSNSAYAVIEFGDGTYAFSQGVSEKHPYSRLWLAGKPI